MLELRRLLFGALGGTVFGVGAWVVWLILVALSLDFWGTMAGPIAGTVIGVSVLLLERYARVARVEAQGDAPEPEDAPPRARAYALPVGLSTGLLVFGFAMEEILADFMQGAFVPLLASCATLFVVGLILSAVVSTAADGTSSSGGSFLGRILVSILGGLVLGLVLAAAVRGLHALMGYDTRFGGWTLLGIAVAAALVFTRARWSAVVVGVLGASLLVLLTSLPSCHGPSGDAGEPADTASRPSPLRPPLPEPDKKWPQRLAELVMTAADQALMEPDLPREMWTKFEEAARPAGSRAPASPEDAEPSWLASLLGCGALAQSEVVPTPPTDVGFLRYLASTKSELLQLEDAVIRALLDADPALRAAVRSAYRVPIDLDEPPPEATPEGELEVFRSILVRLDVGVMPARGGAVRLVPAFPSTRPEDKALVVEAFLAYHRGDDARRQRLESAWRDYEADLARRDEARRLDLERLYGVGGSNAHPLSGEWRARRLCLEAHKGVESGLLRTFLVLLAFGMGLPFSVHLERRLRPQAYPTSRTRRNDRVLLVVTVLALALGVLVVRMTKTSLDAAAETSVEDQGR